MRGGAELLGGGAALGRGIGHHELAGAAPGRPRDHRQPDRPRADDEHLVARPDVRTLDRMEPDGQRLDHAPSAGSIDSGSPTVSRWSTRTYSANAPELPPTPT